MNLRIVFIFSLLLLSACETAYFNTMEKFGVHKREILVDRVEEARDAQKDAQDQFRSALEQFKSVVSFDGGELENLYDRLNDEFEASEDAADVIRERIDNIESVADALFKEWTEELTLYSNANLRRDSQQKLDATRNKYKQLLAAMRNAEKRLDPVLAAMRDQVLYLKHNLNAQAIQSLKGEAITINREVDNLLIAMEKAIAEADSFIRQMQNST